MKSIVYKCMDDTINSVINNRIFLADRKPDDNEINGVNTAFILAQKDIFDDIRIMAIAKYQPYREITLNDKVKFKNSAKHCWKFSFDLVDLVELNGGKGYASTECFTADRIKQLRSTQIFGYIKSSDYLDVFLETLKNELEQINRHDIAASLPFTVREQVILKQVKLAENSFFPRYVKGDNVKIQVGTKEEISFDIIDIIPVIEEEYLINQKWKVKMSTGEIRLYDAKTVHNIVRKNNERNKKAEDV